MKLYLSSYKIGDETQVMRNWIAHNGNKILIIANAKDQYTDLERVEKGTLNDMEQLESVGFEVEKLDLRNYFGKKEELEQIFTKVKAFYVVGGNTFVLRKAMKLSGFDELLMKYAKQPDYFYGGYSAGVCVLLKDMSGIAMMDDPNIDPYNSGLAAIYQGIGFVQETIIPHFESEHEETEAANNAVKFCKDKNIAYRTLRDGEVIIKNLN